jgi:predicted Zn-dependent peptidase
MLDRTTPPAIRSISKVNLKRAKSIHLSNGIPVHIIDAGQHEIVRVEIILKSGKWFEKFNGIAYFASQMLLEGTSDHTSRELAEFFEYHGAHVNINSGIDYNIFTIYVIRSKLGDIIDIIRKCILDSIFPEKELNILIDIQKQQLKINNEKNTYVAGKEFRRAIYGADHPYGKALELDDYDQISQELIDRYKGDALLRGIEIIISGQVSEKLIDVLEVLSDLPNIYPEDMYHKIVGSGDTDLRIHKKDSLQSSLRVGSRVISKTHDDFSGLIILNELLGGFFGSRLMKNIREEKGYTYGIHSSIVSQLHDSFLVIGTDVKKEFVDHTMDEIYHEVNRLRDELVGVRELTLVKNYLLGNFLSSMETSFALADKFKNIHFFGQDYSFYDMYIDKINSITPLEIQELANKYLNASAFHSVIVG